MKQAHNLFKLYSPPESQKTNLVNIGALKPLAVAGKVVGCCFQIEALISWKSILSLVVALSIRFVIQKIPIKFRQTFC